MCCRGTGAKPGHGQPCERTANRPLELMAASTADGSSALVINVVADCACRLGSWLSCLQYYVESYARSHPYAFAPADALK